MGKGLGLSLPKLPPPPGNVACVQVLFPVERRDVGDSVGDEGPVARPAAPQEVFRGHQQPRVRPRPRHRGDVQQRDGEGRFQPGYIDKPDSRCRREVAGQNATYCYRCSVV